MKIGIACDHAGYEFKEKTKEYFLMKNIKIIDFGCYSLESVDYPDFSHKLSNSIEKKECDFGIQFCGTGNGINMVANKHQDIRSALCWNTHIAEQSRLHNNANVLSFGCRTTSLESMKSMIKIFIESKFQGGRHERRINKIEN